MSSSRWHKKEGVQDNCAQSMSEEGRYFLPPPSCFLISGDLPWTVQEKHKCTSVFPSNPPSCPTRIESSVRTLTKTGFLWQIVLMAVNSSCILLPAATSSCMLFLYYVSSFITIFPSFSCQLQKLALWWIMFLIWGVVIMFEKLKMAEVLVQSGRNYERGAGDFRHCSISSSRLGRAVMCSLACEGTCHAHTCHSGP